MKKIKIIIAAAVLVAVLVLAATACGLIEKTPAAIAKSTVAEINGVKITRAELDANPSTVQLIANVKSYYGDNYQTNEAAMSYLKTQKTTILQQMINEELVIQEGKELNIGQDEKEIQQEVAAKYDSVKSGYATEEAFETALSSSGFDETSFKAYLENQIKIEKVSEYISKNVTVTDQQVLAYYNANPYQYTQSPDTIHAARILVATEADAEAVEARLDAGEDFAAVAKQVSIDTASSANGGDIGTLNYVGSGYDSTFMAAAIALKAGAVSAPVQTSDGYNIIKCIAKTEYPVEPFNTVEDSVKQTVLENAQSTAVSNQVSAWAAAANITTYDNNIV